MLRTEMFAGAMISVVQCLAPIWYVQLLEELEGHSPRSQTSRLKELDWLLQRQQQQLLPATKAPPLPPASSFPWDVRRKLAISISCLNAEHSYGLIEVLHSCHSGDSLSTEELVLDLDELPLPVLAKLAVLLSSSSP
jgi:hypothetical protein